MDVTRFWADAPPAESPRLTRWLQRAKSGWRPNRRVRATGYHTAAEFYRVYIWEYLNVLRPLLREQVGTR